MYRYLLHLGYKVRYVRNITDAGHLESDADEGEDKIAKKARLEQLEPMEIVQRYTVDFHNVMNQFNSLPPSIEPTATGHIIEQIEMIRKILDRGLAYEVNGSVYFDVNKYNEKEHYGILSGRNVEELMSGTRDLDGQGDKRSPVDFALWKKAEPQHIMRWESPWGVGFPGWHLECSVMSSKYLGEKFDIHGGGMDLKFPHHECEIAQCNAAHNAQPVKYWLHANMLTLNGKRMSKSTGNSILPRELFSGDNDFMDKPFDPIVVRFFMMQAHYRSTLDFSSDALMAAEKGFNKLMHNFNLIEELPVSDSSSENVDDLIESWYSAMDDDFNSPILIAGLFEACKWIKSIEAGAATITEADRTRLYDTMSSLMFDVLGLMDISSGKEVQNDKGMDEELMNLILDIRQEAKAEGNFKTADKIRDRLQNINITIQDSKVGSTWKKN